MRALHSFPVLAIYAVLLALGLGLGTAAWTTNGRYPLGAVRIGPWTAWPRVGSRDVDPYARAVMARTGDIPMTAGEGLMLMAGVDDEERPLDGRCTYRIGSAMPAARAWTLTVYDPAGEVATGNEAGRGGFASAEVLREANGAFAITASPEAHPGNWLPLPPSGRFVAALRLYDTPVTVGSVALDRGALPSIARVECLP